MTLIIKRQQDPLEISIWSNGKKYWLVITDDGRWIQWNLIPRSQMVKLKGLGIDYHIDKGMSGPDVDNTPDEDA